MTIQLPRLLEGVLEERGMRGTDRELTRLCISGGRESSSVPDSLMASVDLKQLVTTTGKEEGCRRKVGERE